MAEEHSVPMAVVRADFDRLAPLHEEGRWSHNSHYHRFLLRHLPPHCRDALEVGCGTGGFARLLAERADRVVAVDLSPRMIALAEERSQRYPNIRYVLADVMEQPPAVEAYDGVVAIATLHHLPPERALPRLAAGLRGGGTLVVLDLLRTDGVLDVLASAVAFPFDIIMRLVRTGGLRDRRAIRDAWREHGKHECYLSLSQVRRICATVLPGAQVRRHLFWRYSIVWRRPGTVGVAGPMEANRSR